MKPEEIDRLFRDELEKLDRVPGLEWNDASVWEKISSGLKGGRGSLTWGVSVITVVIGAWLIYRFMPSKQPLVIQEPRVIPAVPSPAKTDTVTVAKAIAPVLKKKHLSGNVEQVVQLIDSVASSHVDSFVVLNRKIDSVSVFEKVDSIRNRAVSSRFLSRRRKYQLPDSAGFNPDFKFSLPQSPVLRLKVNNGFNLPNLIKSIEAGKNANGDVNYIYEYDERPPSPYENTRIQDGYNKRHIITNLKK